MDSSSTQESSLSIIPSNNTTATNAIDQTPSLPSIHNTYISAKTSWMKWYAAFKNILPTYILIHLAFFVITCLAVLFTLKDFSPQSMSISTLWQSWLHWDTINFRAIAANGYTMSRLTAFFPLYPLLERSLTFLTHDYLIAGLIISNLSGLGMLVILYRLVQEDFDHERAARTVLYLSVFPSEPMGICYICNYILSLSATLPFCGTLSLRVDSPLHASGISGLHRIGRSWRKSNTQYGLSYDLRLHTLLFAYSVLDRTLDHLNSVSLHSIISSMLGVG